VIVPCASRLPDATTLQSQGSGAEPIATSGERLPSSNYNPGMKYWLMKTEPDECSIDDALAAPGRITPWTGVRNYQARNFMREQMQVGDGVLFYHSSCPEPGIAGLAEVASAAYPDKTQFDRKSPYYDAASKKDAPRWYNVDVRALRKTRLISLPEMREQKPLARMVTLRPGNRLSITPVTEAEWKHIQKLL
jgi:predicted RNA-binding protein with PUA-like domain